MDLKDEIEYWDKKIEEVREINRQWQRNFNYLFELKHNGEIFEKNGNIAEAIKAYNQAFEFGKTKLNFNNYASILERLIILYRKTKDYQNEIDILTFCLSHDMHQNHRIKYEQRLKKAELLKNNQQ